MRPKRKVQRTRVSAQVISLASYRETHRRHEADPAPVRTAPLVETYCRWLALAGALWACWW